MKRFFLYLLFFLFIAGFATLAYGFWNAKNIRVWAKDAAKIKSENSISEREKNIEEKMNASGGKTAAEFNVELTGFVGELNEVSRQLDKAGSQMQQLKTPGAAAHVRSELLQYYQAIGEDVKNVAAVAGFMNRVFDVTEIFDRMKPDATADDIRSMISEAKDKSEKIDASVLSAGMKNSGIDLRDAAVSYLDEFNKYATGEAESKDRLDASYSIFSEKINDFLVAKKKYFSTFPDIDSMSRKIDNDLMVLERVKFSLK